MNHIDPETLMAYADGELDDAQVREVEILLANDADARAMVERFRQTRAELAPALNILLDEPVPQRLIDTVRQHPMGRLSDPVQTPPSVAQAQTLPAQRAARNAANSPSYWPRVAAAACLAMAVGLTAGHRWGSNTSAGAGDVAQTLQRALQTLPSGESLAASGVQVMPVASFRAANGQACREFEQESQGRLAHGLACREGNQWVARVVLDRGPANGKMGDVPAFAPASGEADALATLLDRLGASAVLGAQEEQALIQQGWTPPR